MVTGHEGFLGSNLVKRLIGSGCRITGIDLVSSRPLSVLAGLRSEFAHIRGDISNFNLTERIIKSKRPNIIFHLAAEAVVGKAKRNPVRTFRSNIEGTWNLLEACRGRGFVEAIVVASSDKAYGSKAELPYTEEMSLEGLQPYDASKSCEDIIARAYHRSYGLPVCVIRCGNIYGPGDYNFSRLIPDAIRCLIKGEGLAIRSDGTYTRDYVYVDDIVEGYILLAEKMKRLRIYGGAFNLSNERPLSVMEVFEKIKEAFGGSVKRPKVLNVAQDEIKDQYLSSKKARRLLGWRPRYTIEKGLQRTIYWYENNSKKF